MNKRRGYIAIAAIAAAVMLAAPAGVMAIGFQVPGTDTTIDVGGYVKLDVVFNDAAVAGDNQANIEYVPGAVPLDDDGEENEVEFNARESRLWVKTTTPTKLGPLKTFWEGDFDTDESSQVVSNSRGFRLRHAYGTLKGFLFGQTWSLFMHLNSLPEINDFGGPTGSMFVRQAQLRYTWDLNDTTNIAVGLENPETYYYTGAALADADDDNAPDIIARFSTNPSWGNISAALMIRNLVVDNAIVDDSTLGFSGQVGAQVDLFARDSLMAAIQYGQGLGRYSSLATHPDAFVDAAGDLEALDQLATFVGYQHYWVGTWRSTLVVGYSKADDPSELSATDLTEETLSVHANLMFNPVENTRLGIEYIHAERRKPTTARTAISTASSSRPWSASEPACDNGNPLERKHDAGPRFEASDGGPDAIDRKSIERTKMRHRWMGISAALCCCMAVFIAAGCSGQAFKAKIVNASPPGVIYRLSEQEALDLAYWAMHETLPDQKIYRLGKPRIGLFVHEQFRPGDVRYARFKETTYIYEVDILRVRGTTPEGDRISGCTYRISGEGDLKEGPENLERLDRKIEATFDQTDRGTMVSTLSEPETAPPEVGRPAPGPHQAVESPANLPAAVQQTAPSGDDAFEKLEKLKELLDRGIITQEEFDAKKKELLERI